jgi:hypothetical protein
MVELEQLVKGIYARQYRRREVGMLYLPANIMKAPKVRRQTRSRVLAQPWATRFLAGHMTSI